MRLRRQQDGSGRFLTTILFVDIVGSTELASSIGDAAWQGLLSRYYATVRDRLRRFGGREIDTAGDGLFAAFNAPADGIRCASAIRDAATELGLTTRAGLHMGEAQTIDGKVGGIAVHIGARIAAMAGPGEVLASSTIKELVEGSGLQFEDRGEATLKGVPGQWRLYVALPPVAADVTASGARVSAGVRSSVAHRTAPAGALGRIVPRSPRARGLVVAAVAIVLAATVGNILLAGKAGPSPTPGPSGLGTANPSAIQTTAPTTGKSAVAGVPSTTGPTVTAPAGPTAVTSASAPGTPAPSTVAPVAVARVSPGASPQAVAMVGAQPLFTAWAVPGNHMGGTLRIVGGAVSFPSSPDPSWNPFDSQVFPLTNDALVTYRQVGGPDGLQLVPDLATSLPMPSPDGLTYVFQLRSGISFSTGQPVRASDVLWSAEREEFAGKPFGGVLVPDVLDTKDIADCTAARCDLSNEIQVDDATGTITFHLIAPDPFFLYSLTLVYIVPAETPFAQSAKPLPATGPYEFTRFDATEVVLKRNPSFQVWSQNAQPQGYPDEIDWLEVPDEAAALADVEAGQADWLADDVTIEQVDQLRTDLPAQLNIAPSTKTWAEVMNTSSPPFNNVLVRRAINDVVDRQAVADAFSGGVVTCQSCRRPSPDTSRTVHTPSTRIRARRGAGRPISPRPST